MARTPISLKPDDLRRDVARSSPASVQFKLCPLSPQQRSAWYTVTGMLGVITSQLPPCQQPADVIVEHQQEWELKLCANDPAGAVTWLFSPAGIGILEWLSAQDAIQDLGAGKTIARLQEPQAHTLLPYPPRYLYRSYAKLLDLPGLERALLMWTYQDTAETYSQYLADAALRRLLKQKLRKMLNNPQFGIRAVMALLPTVDEATVLEWHLQEKKGQIVYIFENVSKLAAEAVLKNYCDQRALVVSLLLTQEIYVKEIIKLLKKSTAKSKN